MEHIPRGITRAAHSEQTIATMMRLTEAALPCLRGHGCTVLVITQNMNGFYHHRPYSSNSDGVVWDEWKGGQYSLQRSEMKIRPVDWIPF